MKVSRKSAFTLIELLVVIAIIALLISILTPALSSAREQAKRAKCQVHLHQIGVAIYEYAHEREGRIPWALVDPGLGGQVGYDDTPNTDVDTWQSLHIFNIKTDGDIGSNDFSNKSPERRGAWNLGLLFSEGYVEDGHIFYCPSTEDTEFYPNGIANPIHFRYDDYRNGPKGWPYGDIDPHVRIGFNYYPQSKEVANTAYAGVGDYQVKAEKIEDINGSYTMVTDLIYDYYGIPHRASNDTSIGLDALFGDGHVKYTNSYEAFEPFLWGRDSAVKTDKPGDNLAKFIEIVSLLRP